MTDQKHTKSPWVSHAVIPTEQYENLIKQRDELREVLEKLKEACKNEPAMNHMKYDGLGILVNDTLTKTKEGV